MRKRTVERRTNLGNRKTARRRTVATRGTLQNGRLYVFSHATIVLSFCNFKANSCLIKLFAGKPLEIITWFKVMDYLFKLAISLNIVRHSILENIHVNTCNRVLFQCSRSCGGGVRTRHVQCYNDEMMPASQCYDHEKPEHTHICNTQRCTTVNPELCMYIFLK